MNTGFFDPYDWRRIPVLLAARVEALPDDLRQRVLHRLRVDPHSFAIERLPGGWCAVSVGTAAHGPGIDLGKFHISALAEAPGAVN